MEERTLIERQVSTSGKPKTQTDTRDGKKANIGRKPLQIGKVFHV